MTLLKLLTGDVFIWSIVVLNAVAAVVYLANGNYPKAIMAGCAAIMNGAFIAL